MIFRTTVFICQCLQTDHGLPQPLHSREIQTQTGLSSLDSSDHLVWFPAIKAVKPDDETLPVHMQPPATLTIHFRPQAQ